MELLLRHWSQMKLNEIRLEVNEERRTEWQWTLGDVGQSTQQELQTLGWWNSVDTYRRSLTRTLIS